MVEINNQRKAFLDMLAWSEGEVTDVRKLKSPSYDIGWRAVYWLSPSQTCHAKPKTQINRAPDATSFFPVGGMPTANSLAWKTSLRSQDAVALQQIKGVALYLWLIVVISVGQSTVKQYLGFTAGRWLWSVRA